MLENTLFLKNLVLDFQNSHLNAGLFVCAAVSQNAQNHLHDLFIQLGDQPHLEDAIKYHLKMD